MARHPSAPSSEHDSAAKTPAHKSTVQRASEPAAVESMEQPGLAEFLRQTLGNQALVAGSGLASGEPGLARTTLQRMIAPYLDAAGAQAETGTVQRAVYQEGGKKAVAVPSEARSVGRWVTTKASVQPGGSNYIADVQGRGLAGFKMGKAEYVGGRVFNNNPMPDGSRLPYSAGQVYQEWDIRPCQAGANRGEDRIITGSNGSIYFTNDHYKNFTQFTLR